VIEAISRPREPRRADGVPGRVRLVMDGESGGCASSSRRRVARDGGEHGQFSDRVDSPAGPPDGRVRARERAHDATVRRPRHTRSQAGKPERDPAPDAGRARHGWSGGPRSARHARGPRLSGATMATPLERFPNRQHRAQRHGTRICIGKLSQPGRVLRPRYAGPNGTHIARGDASSARSSASRGVGFSTASSTSTP